MQSSKQKTKKIFTPKFRFTTATKCHIHIRSPRKFYDSLPVKPGSDTEIDINWVLYSPSNPFDYVLVTSMKKQQMSLPFGHLRPFFKIFLRREAQRVMDFERIRFWKVRNCCNIVTAQYLTKHTTFSPKTISLSFKSPKAGPQHSRISKLSPQSFHYLRSFAWLPLQGALSTMAQEMFTLSSLSIRR